MHDGHDCDCGAAMVARVGTVTPMVESGLLDTLRTSCELICVFNYNALWQGAGSGG